MVLSPVYRISANSADISAIIADRFKSLVITDEAGLESDTMELTLSDHDEANPIEIPPPGAELEVFMGYDTAATRMGLFIADEVELSGWPGEMVIRARASIYNQSKTGKTDLQTQKTRSWTEGTTLGAMAAKIAKEHNMESAVTASLASFALPHFDQTDESDISFLARVTKRLDAFVKPSGGKIIIAKRGEAQTVSGAAMPTITVDASSVTRFSMIQAVREKPGTVVAYYHDNATAKRVEVNVGSGDPVRRLRHNYPNATAAQKAAQAELDSKTRRKNSISITMPGNPNIGAECLLVLTGFRSGVNGRWLVNRVVHSLDSSGYHMTVEAEKPNA